MSQAGKKKKGRGSGGRPAVPVHAVRCGYGELVAVGELKPHPRNPNRHPPEQVHLLGKLIEAHGWRQPVTVSRRSGFVVAGHGRLMAAELIGEKFVPVDYQDFDSDELELAYLTADNASAELSAFDKRAVDSILADLEAADLDSVVAGVLEELGEGKTEIRDLTPQEAPALGWVLIGAPIEEFGVLQGMADEAAARVPGAVVEVGQTSAGEGDGAEGR